MTPPFDATSKVFLWDSASRRYVAGTTTWERHCSGDLPAVSAVTRAIVRPNCPHSCDS
jgi:hypothetical protein